MRSDRLLLNDMLAAIDEVVQTTPATREEYDQNKLIRSHLARNIQIVGEAAARIGKTLKDQNPQVPWRLIAGMRHAIVHDYFEIDWSEVHNTAKRDIPSLRPLIESIIAQYAPEPER